jgi:hypothetical protein
MLKLDAVNICIRALGDPAVTALDTGGTSDAGEAESEIDRQLKIVLRGRGYGTAANTREEVELTLPDTTVTASGGSGTFTYDETITQAGIGSGTGKFRYETGGKVYVDTVSGTWNASGALTGGTSGATRATVTATAAITSAFHAVPETAFMFIRPARREWKRLGVYNGFLFDEDQDTQTFTGSIYIDAITVRTWDETPEWIQEYVARKAARQFQRFKKRGVTDDQMLREDEALAQLDYERMDNMLKGTNVLERSTKLSEWVPVMP